MDDRTATDEDIGIRRKGPLPWVLGILLGASLGLLLCVLFSNLAERSLCFPISEPAVCKYNLKQMGNAVALYQAENNELAPISWSDLFSDDGFPAKAANDLLRCPSSGTEPAPTTMPADINAHCDYILISGVGKLDGNELSDSLLAFELPVNHKQRVVNLLFTDCHLEGWVDISMFNALVQKTNDHLAARRLAKK